ncbi:MAG: CinA family protein [Clostridia bacterium]|nr:CinA family protein [Clostridia bacterium]
MIFEKAVGLLKEKGLTVTFAESCTGGLLAKSVTDVAGASAVFPGSAVTYSNRIKESVVHVDPETIEKYTEVSHAAAREMAAGAAAVFGADIAVSVTGYAGPGGGTENDPAGTVYVGVYARGRVDSYRFYFADADRAHVRELCLSFAAYITEVEASRL